MAIRGRLGLQTSMMIKFSIPVAKLIAQYNIKHEKLRQRFCAVTISFTCVLCRKMNYIFISYWTKINDEMG